MPARAVAAAILVGALSLPLLSFTLLRLAVPAAATPAPPIPAARVSSVPALAPAPAPAPGAVRALVQQPAAAVATVATPAAAAPLAIRRVLDTGGPIRYGSYFWDEAAVPAGPLTITVDLKTSVLSVFRGGYEIGTTAVIYGADDRETPLGVFPILQKDRHHFSSRYHHAPMPYMLRLTRDGVSIHASEIAADYATHGCIGVPAGFARKLFAVTRLGDRVIVTRQGLRSDLNPARPITS